MQRNGVARIMSKNSYPSMFQSLCIKRQNKKIYNYDKCSSSSKGSKLSTSNVPSNLLFHVLPPHVSPRAHILLELSSHAFLLLTPHIVCWTSNIVLNNISSSNFAPFTFLHTLVFAQHNTLPFLYFLSSP